MEITAEYAKDLSGEQLGALKEVSDIILKLDALSKKQPSHYSTFEYSQYAKIMKEDEADFKIIKMCNLSRELKEAQVKASGLGLRKLDLVDSSYLSLTRLIDLINPCGLVDRYDKPETECDRKKRCVKAINSENMNVCTKKWGWEVATYMAKEGNNYEAQKHELTEGMKVQMVKDKKIMLDSGKIIDICNSKLENILKEIESHANDIYARAKQISIVNEANRFMEIYRSPREPIEIT